MKNYPKRGEVYTMREILEDLILRDSPFFMVHFEGDERSNPIQYEGEDELRKVPGLLDTRWWFDRVTDEWIPVFYYCDNNEKPITEYVTCTENKGPDVRGSIELTVVLNTGCEDFDPSKECSDSSLEKNEWIPTYGKKPDLPDNALIDIKFADGTEVNWHREDFWSWTQNGRDDDITHYRIRQPEPCQECEGNGADEELEEDCSMDAKEFDLANEPEQQGHVHAELMAQYAEDAKIHAEPWKLWQFSFSGDKWLKLRENPSWGTKLKYRRKPETHIVNGVKIPDLRVAPERGDSYYLADPTASELTTLYRFTGTDIDKIWVERGLAYQPTEEGKQAAILHSKAMLGVAGGTTTMNETGDDGNVSAEAFGTRQAGSDSLAEALEQIVEARAASSARRKGGDV